MSNHPEIAQEQAYLDFAYARIEELKAVARSAMDDVLDLGKGGTFQARTERDMVVRSALARLDQLEIGNQPLCFGRIDEVEGDKFYIGRLGVSGPSQEVLVVDWRAPVAEPFYRATGRFPMGLSRRRHFGLQGRKLVSIEDEPMIHSGDTEALPVSGRGALLAALERTRTGRMSDIVATIQGEQDEIIRSPLAGVQVVQGGPGTGKTAVALHRAAYLLYTHRFPLELQGVLVVGPNPMFLRYISQVLPSLGESGVVLSTISGLYINAAKHDPVISSSFHPARSIVGVDTPATAAVKGDIRMVEFIARAVKTRERSLPGDLIVNYGSYRLRVTRQTLKRIVARIKRRNGTHNARRQRFEQFLFEALFDSYNTAVERARGYDPSVASSEFADFVSAMKLNDEVSEALARMWPRLTAEELMHDLYGAPALIGVAGRNLLSSQEASFLERPRSGSLEAVEWTEADIALLDEARELLGPVRKLKEDEVFTPTYGHVVADEAQDLSPMQLRMLSRRCLGGSLTMVGDIAQATGPWAPTSWSDVTSHLPMGWALREVELTIGYRTPAEAMQLAAPVLKATGLDLIPPRPVRESGLEPRFIATHDSQALVGSVVEEAMRESGKGAGTCAVIVPDVLYDQVEAALQEAGVVFGTAQGRTVESDLILLLAPQAKGLEFDSVIVVEPNAIVAQAAHGMRALYVALTRTTTALTICWSKTCGLPEALQQANSPEQVRNQESP